MGTDEARRRASEALAKGATRSPTRPVVEWSVAGTCTDPRPITMEGRKWLDHDTWNQHPDAFWLDMEVRCRRCRECLKARAHHWAERAILETGMAQRTWFGTLTFSPSEQFATEARARVAHAGGWAKPMPRRWNESQVEWENRVRELQFTRLHAANGALLTKWLKRVRKESGASLRYILVAEAHKSGRPHYHCLVHEIPGSPPLRHRVLSRQWIHGFSQFKLADPDAARYVCKYLSKAVEARIRASLNYGRVSMTPSDSGVANRRGARQRAPRL